MKSYSSTYASCCAFVIIITGWCLEDFQVPTPCVQHGDACADTVFEATENDVVNLLQKQATVLQRQTEELRVGSTGSRIEHSDKSHFAKTLDKLKASPDVSGQLDSTKWPMTRAGTSGMRSLLLASVFKVVDSVQTKVALPNFITIVCVGFFILAMFMRKCTRTGQKQKKDTDATISRLTQSSSSVANESDGEEAKFGIAKFTGLLLSVCDANDFMVLTFLPAYLASRGMSKTQVGLCFTAQGIVIMLVALRMPYIVKTTRGQKLGVWWGIRLYSVTRLPFMALIFVPDWIFFPVVVISFVLTGIAYTLIECCAISWTLASVEAEDRTAALGLMMGGRTLGALLGPAFGGVLFSFLGLTVPFAVGFIALVLIQEYCTDAFSWDEPVASDAEDTPQGRTDSIMRSPGVFICQVLMMLFTANLMGTIVWMQFNLEEGYGLSPWVFSLLTVGVTFLSSFSLGCCVSLIENGLGTYKTMLLGIVLLSASYLVSGPSPWLPFLPATEFWIPVFGFTLWGVSFTLPFGIVPALGMNIALASGWSELDASVQLASVQSLCTGAGTTIGPSVFMAITDAVGSRASSSYLCVGLLGVLGGLWLILVWLNPPVATSAQCSDGTLGKPRFSRSSLRS